jgi:hypothetical protein
LIAGSAKTVIPALLDDWILFDFVPNRKPHDRMFQIGPQGKWASGGRNVTRSCQVPATVPAMFAELGIKP